MAPAPAAELLELHPVGRVPLRLRRLVVAALALGAGERDRNSHSTFGHVALISRFVDCCGQADAPPQSRGSVARTARVSAAPASESRRSSERRAQVERVGCWLTTNRAFAISRNASSSNASCSGSSAGSIAPSDCASLVAPTSSPNHSSVNRIALSRTGPRMRVHLGRDGGEEAAAGEHALLDVHEKPLVEPAKPFDPRRRGERGVDHLGDEHRAGRLDGRELELLLRAEVGEEPALAHPDRVGQPADREPGDPLDRRQLAPPRGGSRCGSARRRSAACGPASPAVRTSSRSSLDTK